MSSKTPHGRWRNVDFLANVRESQELLRIKKDAHECILTQKKFKCRLCGETFNTAAERDEHNRQVHPKAYRLSHLFSGKKKEAEPKAE